MIIDIQKATKTQSTEIAQAGELYLDSLAVCPEYRHKGIATQLLKATKEKADAMDNQWGGHPMKHLIW